MTPNSPLKQGKLFATGGSQAVRLPAEFRFPDGVEAVYVRRNAAGEVVLSSVPPRRYAEFVRVRDRLGPVPDDFLSPAERGSSSTTRDPFAADDETSGAR